MTLKLISSLVVSRNSAIEVFRHLDNRNTKINS